MSVKVLMINTVPMIFDGIGMTILNYVTNMDRTDMVVDFCVINHVEPNMRLQIESLGCKIHELIDRNVSQWKYVLSLRKLVKEGGYNIVHIHCNSCTAAVDLLGAKLGGAKLLCTHSHNTKCVHTKMHTLLRPLFNLLYTDGFACGVEAGHWLYGDRKFIVLKNATNIEKYEYNQEYREMMRKRLNLHGKIAIGHVAHFTYHKNHPFLLKVMADVVKRDKRYVLFLIGDGKLRKDIEFLLHQLGIEQSVVLVGTTLEIPQYLSAMDMMVLPSLWEGLPNVVIEWQVNGLPTLVADTVTPDCKLTDSVKFIPLDTEVWVKEILSVKYDINRMEQSQENSMGIARKGFSIKEEAAKLKAYYLKRLKELI